jgi:tRNA G18 (ribose-2'-O)-methylase SpoU
MVTFLAAPVPVETITSLSDPRIAAYTNLKERDLARGGDRFIAEGEHVVRRLLASNTPVESVLLAPWQLEKLAPLCRAGVAIYTADEPLVRQILGFKFHSGAMACGIRPPRVALNTVIPPAGKPALLVVCEEISNLQNMGSMIRIAAAFGATALVLGPRCCDPYFRQSVRVSMGTIFSLPLVRSRDLMADLDALAAHGITRFATVLDTDAEPLSKIAPVARAALVFGSEARGLSAEAISRCDRRVTIPMHLGTASLNVAIAAAVFLYHFAANRP